MLISRLKQTLLKPRRPARRRTTARTIHSQDLEPRLFLSVNSLVTTEVASSADADAVESDVESDAIDDAQLTVAMDTVSPDSSSPQGSGYPGGPGQNNTSPNFVNVYMGEDEFGIYIEGTIEWPDSGGNLSGLQVLFYDANGNLVGEAVTQDAPVEGYFYWGDTQETQLTAELIDPNTGNVADSVVVFL